MESLHRAMTRPYLVVSRCATQVLCLDLQALMLPYCRAPCVTDAQTEQGTWWVLP